ncbi:hypothetical protein HDV05_000675 [Chytridiales sp. JEL 0842]|nr:hypothetical protein HDV05_000675 [Chytridiales sp. JEL 0842]
MTPSTPIDPTEEDPYFPPSSDLFADSTFVPRLTTDAPRTLVNSIPLDGSDFIAPFVPCTIEAAYEALVYANVNATDTLVDLGCGDARILTTSLTLPSPPATCIGVELDPHLCTHLRKTLPKTHPSAPIRILESNMFDVDLESLRASVVVLYLLPGGLERLKGLLGVWMRNGDGRRRVVTLGYEVPGWEPKKARRRGEGEVGGMEMFYYDVDVVG